MKIRQLYAYETPTGGSAGDGDIQQDGAAVCGESERDRGFQTLCR